MLPASHVCNIFVVHGTVSGGFIGTIWNYIAIRVIALIALGPPKNVGPSMILLYLNLHKSFQTQQHLKVTPFFMYNLTSLDSPETVDFH